MTPDAVIDRELADSLDAGLAALSMPLENDARAALVAYVALLAKWNRTYNLTAIREPARMITHHVLDSLAVLPSLDAFVGDRRDVQVLDVGSGAGLPGIPIAVARPSWRVELLEPVQKKSAFLTQAIAELRLANAQAIARRVEDYRAAVPVTLAISRAFSDLASFAEASIRHVADDGTLVAMKGVHPDEELRELPDAFVVTATISLQVPGIDAARHLIFMQLTQKPDRALRDPSATASSPRRRGSSPKPHRALRNPSATASSPRRRGSSVSR
jgi:16S rRNA (guanine527-N7)-methyltransferase